MSTTNRDKYPSTPIINKGGVLVEEDRRLVRVGIDAVCLMSGDYKIHRLVTSRGVVSEINDKVNSKSFDLHPYKKNIVWVKKGFFNTMEYEVYFGGRVVLRGALSPFLYEKSNLYLLSPEEHDNAVRHFELKHNANLNKAILTSVEIGAQLLLPFSLEDLNTYFGYYETTQLPYIFSSDVSSSNGTMEWSTSPTERSHNARGKNRLKVYPKDLQLKDKGVLLDIPDGYHLFRFELTLRTDLKRFSSVWDDHLYVSDLGDPWTYSELLHAFLRRLDATERRRLPMWKIRRN